MTGAVGRILVTRWSRPNTLRGCRSRDRGTPAAVNATVLWVIAVILVIVGIVQLLQGQVIFGIVLIILGCLVGPGGVSIFNRR